MAHWRCSRWPISGGSWALAPPVAATASIVTVTAPLFWFMAARPLTDVPGLVAAVAVQGVFLRGRVAFSRAGHTGLPREWLWAAAAAGFVAGLRVQTLLLTGPLLLWAAGALLVVRRRVVDTGKLAAAAAAGVLVWAVPLLWDSGGLGGYLRALGGQGQQDFAEVSMLATTPSWRLLQQTMHHTFVDPWYVPTLSHVVAGLALIGLVRMVWTRWPAAVPLLVAFLPYLIFHFLFHETVFVRYALPLLVPVCGLAVVALSALGTRAAIAGGAAIAAASLITVQPHLQAYARNASPEFEVFRDMQRARHALPPGSEMPLLRTHHQVWHVVRRTMDWYRPDWDVGPQPFPSDREWQRLVRHWVSGGTEPVWLLGDLSRNDVRLFDWRTTRLRGRYELDSAGSRIDGRRPAGRVELVGDRSPALDARDRLVADAGDRGDDVEGSERSAPGAGRGVRPARRRPCNGSWSARAISSRAVPPESSTSHSTARESRAGRSRPPRPGLSSGSTCHRVFHKVASRTRG